LNFPVGAVDGICNVVSNPLLMLYLQPAIFGLLSSCRLRGSPWRWSSMVLWNVGFLSHHYMVSKPTRQ